MEDKQFENNFEEFVNNNIDDVLERLRADKEYKQMNKRHNNLLNEIQNIVGFKLLNKTTELGNDLLSMQLFQVYKKGFKDGINIFSTIK